MDAGRPLHADEGVAGWPLHADHICILYCPGPVLAVLVHIMGIWSQPLKNGLIQHTSF